MLSYVMLPARTDVMCFVTSLISAAWLQSTIYNLIIRFKNVQLPCHRTFNNRVTDMYKSHIKGKVSLQMNVDFLCNIVSLCHHKYFKV